MNHLAKILIVLVVSGICCQGIFLIADHQLEKYNVHKKERLDEIILGHLPFDVLFLGSSKTHTGINPYYVDSVAGCNSYNLGIEGGRINEFKIIWDAYLQNHPKPKLLILSVNLFEFDLRRGFFNHTQYFPYLENNVISKGLDEYGHRTSLHRFLPFLRMSDYDDYTRNNCIKGMMHQTEIDAGNFQYKGFLSNGKKTIHSSLQLPPKEDAVVSTGSVELLKEMIEACKKDSIKVLLVYLPEYKHLIRNNTPNAEAVLKRFQEISDTYQVKFLRHDALELCQDTKLFANAGHLNTAGSIVYSKYLGEVVNNELSKQ
ncbi:MAG TPA: hypothetical protein VK750_02145 [Cytophagaceae bacterium]|jgi:hypothetical protein|nr:hypothetical protein [Cytophagaceae bacterium]